MPDLTITRLLKEGRMVAIVVEGATPTCKPDKDFQCYKVVLKSGSEHIIKAMSEDYARELATRRYGHDVRLEAVYGQS